jgi:hypothetical protein
MLHFLCPGLVLVIVMVGRLSPLFGMTFGPAIQAPNNGDTRPTITITTTNPGHKKCSIQQARRIMRIGL